MRYGLIVALILLSFGVGVLVGEKSQRNDISNQAVSMGYADWIQTSKGWRLVFRSNPAMATITCITTKNRELWGITVYRDFNKICTIQTDINPHERGALYDIFRAYHKIMGFDEENIIIRDEVIKAIPRIEMKDLVLK